MKFDVIGLDSPCVDLAVNVRCFPKPNGAERIQNLSWQGGGKVASGMVATFGEKGCAGISKEGFFEIPAFDVDVKDTVGAGDVFHGAFLAAIVKGLSPKDAARFASGVAAIKCTRIGGRAGIPNWEVTDNFLETGEIDYREIDERVKKYGRGIEYV